MKKFIQPLMISSLSFLLLIGLSFTAPLWAQGSKMTPVQQVMRNAEQDMMSREWNLTHIPDQVNQQFKKEQVSIFQQVNEDFTRIQIINNNVMRAVFVSKIVDYRQISDGVVDIKKHALRLKQNLVLPNAPDESRNHQNFEGSGDERLKASLLWLDHSIMSFVTNPIFKMPNVIDPQLAIAASHDLEAIIQSISVVRKNVEKQKAANNRQ